METKDITGIRHFYSSDFSGMDCLAYVFNKMQQNIDAVQLWTCEKIQFARQFGSLNYKAINSYEDVNNRPLPRPGHLHFYAAGPPCQGLSWAGLRKAWEDPRTRLYMRSIFAIEAARPLAFAIENADNLQNVDSGKLASSIVSRLRSNDYNVHATIVNTKHHGLPQNRARYWIVGIRKDVNTQTFKWPKAIHSLALHELLIPTTKDPGHRDIRPTSTLAAKQVSKAAAIAKEKGIEDDWVIAEHCSETFMPNAQPQTISPALTSGKRAGHWIGSRGRRMTHKEAARQQGYVTNRTRFDSIAANNFFLIGNTMTVPVLKRKWIAVMRAQGYAVSDPWENCKREEDLKNDAAAESLTPSQCHYINAQINKIQCARQVSDTPTHTTILQLLQSKQKRPTDEPHDTPRNTRVQANAIVKPAKIKRTTNKADTQPITQFFQRSDGKPTVPEPKIELHATLQSWNAKRHVKPTQTTQDPTGPTQPRPKRHRPEGTRNDQSAIKDQPPTTTKIVVRKKRSAPEVT